MKKSTVLACIGVIIAFLIVGALGHKKDFYEKQENFKTPEEAIVNFIGYANISETIKAENGYYEKISRKFLESISRRYRLYIGDDRWSYINSQIPQFSSYDLKEITENDLDFIRDYYEGSLEQIPNYIKPIDKRFYSLNGNASNIKYNDDRHPNEDGTFDNIFDIEEVKTTLYLVVVDEGEGYVVDYYYVNNVVEG